MRMVSAREIVGKRITGFTYDSTPGAGSSGSTLHTNVVMRLDDGTFLTFSTEESEGDYGLFVGRHRYVTRPT